MAAIVRTYSLAALLEIQGAFTASGDAAGGLKLPPIRQALTFVDGALSTDPNISGWLYQSDLSYSAATALFLAHATDPFQTAGDAVYSDVAFVPGGKKVKAIYARAAAANTDKIQVARASAQGFLGFVALSDGLWLSAGGIFFWYDPGGDVGGALTTAVNDRLTITPNSGTQALEMLVVYGT
jgi:hypothetical protein